jgi:hypothetical protein
MRSAGVISFFIAKERCNCQISGDCGAIYFYESAAEMKRIVFDLVYSAGFNGFAGSGFAQE